MKLFKWVKKTWYLLTYRFRKEKLYVKQALLSGAGSFIDIRYWFSRPDKIQGRFPIFLIDEETGERLSLMRLNKFGDIKTRHRKHKTAGILLFRNKNNIIKTGSKVTLVFGSLRINHIEVK